MTHTFVRASISISLGFTLAMSEVSSARAADGSLDPTFGNGGVVTTDFTGFDDLGMDVEVQPDGKILVVGNSSDGSTANFGLARYLMDGSLDASFGNGGKVTTDVGSGIDLASAVALQPDGRIIVAGSAYNSTDSDFCPPVLSRPRCPWAAWTVRSHRSSPRIMVSGQVGAR